MILVYCLKLFPAIQTGFRINSSPGFPNGACAFFAAIPLPAIICLVFFSAMLTYFCKLRRLLRLLPFPFLFTFVTTKAAFPSSLLRRIKFFLAIQAYHVGSLQGMKKEHRIDALSGLEYLIVLVFSLKHEYIPISKASSRI